jgi:hypothetical protein
MRPLPVPRVNCVKILKAGSNNVYAATPEAPSDADAMYSVVDKRAAETDSAPANANVDVYAIVSKSAEGGEDEHVTHGQC